METRFSLISFFFWDKWPGSLISKDEFLENLNIQFWVYQNGYQLMCIGTCVGVDMHAHREKGPQKAKSWINTTASF